MNSNIFIVLLCLCTLVYAIQFEGPIKLDPGAAPVLYHIQKLREKRGKRVNGNEREKGRERKVRERGAERREKEKGKQ